MNSKVTLGVLVVAAVVVIVSILSGAPAMKGILFAGGIAILFTVLVGLADLARERDRR